MREGDHFDDANDLLADICMIEESLITELHRTHHSAALEDRGNYGVFTPFWDLVFGTFRYHPERAPVALGVGDPEHYPTSNRVWATLTLPFRPAMTYAGTEQEP